MSGVRRNREEDERERKGDGEEGEITKASN
jgi:hypothetical protein